jgi:hypothetical protein
MTTGKGQKKKSRNRFRGERGSGKISRDGRGDIPGIGFETTDGAFLRWRG